MKSLKEALVHKHMDRSFTKNDLRDFYIVETSSGDFFLVIKDVDKFNVFYSSDFPKKNWNSEGMLYSTTPGGIPDVHNFLYLKDYDENLKRMVDGRFKDPEFDIAEVWKPKKSGYYPDTTNMSDIGVCAKKSGDYIRVFEQ